MAKQTYEDRERARWPKLFKAHKATLTKHGDYQLLRWAKPGAREMEIEYILQPEKGLLFVSGDLRSAAFHWYGGIDLALLGSGVGINYFLEKVQAWPEGDRFKVWNKKEALKGLEFLLEHSDDLIGEAQVPLGTKVGADDVAEFTKDAKSALENEDEWGAFLSGLGGPFHNYLEEARDIGEVPSPYAFAHLIGLKMAWAQLSKQEAAS